MESVQGRKATTTGAVRTLTILEAKGRDFVVHRLVVYIVGNAGLYITVARRIRESGEQYLIESVSSTRGVLTSTPFKLKKGQTLVAQATPFANGDWVYDVEWKEEKQ